MFSMREDEGELDEKSNVQILHIANADRQVAFYSLDVIIERYGISRARRAESKRGIREVPGHASRRFDSCGSGVRQSYRRRRKEAAEARQKVRGDKYGKAEKNRFIYLHTAGTTD